MRTRCMSLTSRKRSVCPGISTVYGATEGALAFVLRPSCSLMA